MTLRRYNLNLLPILRELLQTKSVSRTARNVGLSQSAISAALAKLRDTFDDELLYLEGRQLHLTKRAEALIEPTERAYREANILFQPVDFDQTTAARSFVVATSDYAIQLLGPVIAAQLAVHAPQIRVTFVETTLQTIDELGSGKIDLLIAPDIALTSPRREIESECILSDDVALIRSARETFSQEPMTLERFLASRHAVFKAPSSRSGLLNLYGPATEIPDEARILTVPQYSVLPAIVEASDCVALIHRSMAVRFARTHDIEVISPPFPSPRINLNAFWLKSISSDPAHAWFRKLVFDAGAGMQICQDRSTQKNPPGRGPGG